VFRARGKQKNAPLPMSPTVDIKLEDLTTRGPNSLRRYDVCGISYILTPTLEVRQRGHAGVFNGIIPSIVQGIPHQEINPTNFLEMYRRIQSIAAAPIAVFPA